MRIRLFFLIILSLCFYSCRTMYNVPLDLTWMVLSQEKDEYGYILAGCIMEYGKTDPSEKNTVSGSYVSESYTPVDLSMSLSNPVTKEICELDFFQGNKNPYYLIKVKPGEYKLTYINQYFGNIKRDKNISPANGRKISEFLFQEPLINVKANQITYIGDYLSVIRTYSGPCNNVDLRPNQNCTSYYMKLESFTVSNNFDRANQLILEKIREANLKYNIDIVIIPMLTSSEK